MRAESNGSWLRQIRSLWPLVVVLALVCLVLMPVIGRLYHPFGKDRTSTLTEIEKITNLDLPPDARLLDSNVFAWTDITLLAKLEMSPASANRLFEQVRNRYHVSEVQAVPFSADDRFDWWRPESVKPEKALKAALQQSGPTMSDGYINLMVAPADNSGSCVVYLEWFTM